jgi:hypothetical protein
MKFLDAYYEARRDGRYFNHPEWAEAEDVSTYDMSGCRNVRFQDITDDRWEVVDKPKSQPKFEFYGTVKTPKGFTGEIKSINLRDDHFEYYLESPEGLASWFVESELEHV